MERRASTPALDTPAASATPASTDDDKFRSAIVGAALASVGQTRWGTLLVLKGVPLPGFGNGGAISGVSRMLNVTSHAYQMRARGDVVLDNPGFTHRALAYNSFYPAHFANLHSRLTTSAEKQAAREAIDDGRGGMNCYQHVYSLLDSESAKYPELFALFDKHAERSDDLPYEPLGAKEAVKFGWRTATDDVTKGLIAKPPSERAGAVVDDTLHDPYAPNNPKPGDIVFFVRPPHVIGNAPNMSVRHVAVLVEPDAEGRPQVASTMNLPRAAGNTTSVVAIEALKEEMAADYAPDAFLELKTFPASKVPARIDQFLDELRNEPVAVPRATLTDDERRQLNLG